MVKCWQHLIAKVVKSVFSVFFNTERDRQGERESERERERESERKGQTGCHIDSVKVLLRDECWRQQNCFARIPLARQRFILP